MARFKQVILVILLIGCAVTVLQNTELISLQFLFWKMKIGLIFLVPFLLFIGFLAGWIVAKWPRRKSGKARPSPGSDSSGS